MLYKPYEYAVAFILMITGLFVFFRADTWIVDTKQNGDYTVELIALDEPEWPFGPQNGRIMLKKNGSELCRQDFSLYNDGKNMDSSNWYVDWDVDRATVTIMGEEQSDEVYCMVYAGVAERKEIIRDVR